MFIPPARNRTVPPENWAKRMRFRIVRTMPASTMARPVGKKILLGFDIVIIRRMNMMNLKPSRNGWSLLSVWAGRRRALIGMKATL